MESQAQNGLRKDEVYRSLRLPEAQQLVIDIYGPRILDGESNTQEMLIYLDAMTAARRAQLGVAR